MLTLSSRLSICLKAVIYCIAGDVSIDREMHSNIHIIHIREGAKSPPPAKKTSTYILKLKKEKGK